MLSAESLTPLFLLLAEVLAAVREALTKRRQDQAIALQPAADMSEDHIRALVSEALSRYCSKAAAPGPTVEAQASPPAGLEPHADRIKAHIDALVVEAIAHARLAASGPTSGEHAPALSPSPTPTPPGGSPNAAPEGSDRPSAPVKHEPAGA